VKGLLIPCVHLAHDVVKRGRVCALRDSLAERLRIDGGLLQLLHDSQEMVRETIGIGEFAGRSQPPPLVQGREHAAEYDLPFEVVDGRCVQPFALQEPFDEAVKRQGEVPPDSRTVTGEKESGSAVVGVALGWDHQKGAAPVLAEQSVDAALAGGLSRAAYKPDNGHGYTSSAFRIS